MGIRISCILFITSITFGICIEANAQLSREEYIEMYKDVAIKNMREGKVPASITLAQGLLESGNGNSELAKKSNNHFGIKCNSTWEGKRTYYDDDAEDECFRVYKTVYDSYMDHAVFLQKTRYAKCFELSIMDYDGWAYELKKAGYATNPKYPKLLIEIIEKFELYQYDEQGLKNANSKDALASHKGRNKSKHKSKILDEDLSNSNEIDYYAKPTVQLSTNKIKYVLASLGDTPFTLSNELEMSPWQIRKYNDVDQGYQFTDGQVVYIQPKKNKNPTDFHTVVDGDSIWRISQEYGVKIKKLCRYNNLDKGQSLTSGDKIYFKSM